ncbi:MAG: hypothetical protein NVS4B4_02050 [Bradyrhizobium sp.]
MGVAEAADKCAAMASSACAILSVVSCPEAADGRFAAAAADFRVARGVVFRDFFDIFGVPDPAAITGLSAGRKPLWPRTNEGSGGVAIGTAAAIVRANLPEPA